MLDILVRGAAVPIAAPRPLTLSVRPGVKFRTRPSTRPACILAGAVAATLAAAGPAAAAEPRTGVLTCGSSTYQVAGQLNGNAYKIAGSSSTFIVTSLVVEDGRVLDARSPGDAKKATQRCTYVVSNRTDTAVVEGHLSPGRRD